MMQPAPTTHENSVGSAHLTAVWRAIESERPDALFHDPYARLLAGPEGEAYAAPKRNGAWALAVRTSVYDEIILKTIAHASIDMVLNLASGFDTRPYRLALPESLRWMEVDLPSIQARKDELLAGERPVCRLERVSLDLMQREARAELLARVGKEATRVLVITEGLLGYLAPEEVAALAVDLYAQPALHFWLTDFPPAYILMSGGSSIMKFAPPEGLRFFEQQHWHVAEFRALIKESHRLKRTMPLAWLVRVMTWLNFLLASDRRSQSHVGGFVLLERDEMSRSSATNRG